MEHKGQSALEYLMTYGWALVVIVIAVAALVILINPSQLQGNRCDAKIGPFPLSAESSIVSDRATFVLSNGLGVVLSTVEFQLLNNSTQFWPATAGTWGTCTNACMNPNQTLGFTCSTFSPVLSGPYNITVKVRYGTPNVTAVANRPIVSATCTGTIPA